MVLGRFHKLEYFNKTVHRNWIRNSLLKNQKHNFT